MLVTSALLMGLSSCSTEVPYRLSALSADPAGTPATSTRTASPTHFTLSTGYQRTIPAKTEFVRVGEIPEGAVLRAKSYVLTVEGANVHEAYLVVSGSRLVGFYLPYEHGFAPLTESIPISFLERED